MRVSKPPKTQCNHCGACCRKGGPALHLDDQPLVENGAIPLSDLFTIREGEPAFDNVRQSLSPAPSDIVKIKGMENSWTCRYYDEPGRRCLIYVHRPLECRVLKCWDTRKIEAVYAQTRLTRRELIQNVDGLWDLAQSHQQRCSYDAVLRFIDPPTLSVLEAGPRELILERIRYDRGIRDLVTEKGLLSHDLLDFLFGRPFDVVIRPLGLAF
jgi:Fe-S-cluster containining protein